MQNSAMKLCKQRSGSLSPDASPMMRKSGNNRLFSPNINGVEMSNVVKRTSKK